mgnify:CR=1 FL=1|jgi:hypothetical protein
MSDTPETPETHIHTIEEAKAAEELLVQQSTHDDLQKLQQQVDVA